MGYRLPEAKLCEGEDVALVGAGNSAGQAVAFLSPRVRRLHLVVRPNSLAGTISKYLIDRIAAIPKVVFHAESDIAALEGDRTNGLSAASFRHRSSGELTRQPLRHVFVFIGAEPNADWLNDARTDAGGFLLTGTDLGEVGTGAHSAAWRPVSPASLRSATCAPDQPSALPPRWGRGQRW